MPFRVRRGPSRRRRVAGASSTVSHAGRMHQGFRKELWTKLVEVLIIDEISMLSGEWLDNLERMLRELTHYYGRGEFQQYLRMPMKDIPAFGGIQVVVVGDFYQLPPIPATIHGETFQRLDHGLFHAQKKSSPTSYTGKRRSRPSRARSSAATASARRRRARVASASSASRSATGRRSARTRAAPPPTCVKTKQGIHIRPQSTARNSPPLMLSGAPSAPRARRPPLAARRE